VPSLAWFLSPVGIVLLGLLDATVIFYLPLAVDVAVIYLAARGEGLFWLYPILATIGWALGSASTYWAGTRIGSDGLSRWIPERRLAKVKNKVHHSGALAMAATGLLPPPFPTTPVVLAAGALSVSRWKFFPAMAGARLLRLMAVAFLGHLYGSRLIRWMNSDPFLAVVWGLVGIAVLGTAWTIYSLIKKTRGERANRTPDGHAAVEPG
jgi:membrane protein YqaA with SNARE-associated domain